MRIIQLDQVEELKMVGRTARSYTFRRYEDQTIISLTPTALLHALDPSEVGWEEHGVVGGRGRE